MRLLVPGGAGFIRSRFVRSLLADPPVRATRTGPGSPSAVTAPNTPRSASKTGADLLALACHRIHGLDVRVTHCSRDYRPYQHPEKAVPPITTRPPADGRVALYGDGGNSREELGHRAAYSFGEGRAATADRYRRHEGRWRG